MGQVPVRYLCATLRTTAPLLPNLLPNHITISRQAKSGIWNRNHRHVASIDQPNSAIVPLSFILFIQSSMGGNYQSPPDFRLTIFRQTKQFIASSTTHQIQKSEMQGQTCAASCCVTVHVSITDALRHVSTTLCAATPVLRYAPLHPARKSSSVFFTTQAHHNETSPSSLHLSIRILPRHARQVSCHSTNFVFSNCQKKTNKPSSHRRRT